MCLNRIKALLNFRMLGNLFPWLAEIFFLLFICLCRPASLCRAKEKCRVINACGNSQVMAQCHHHRTVGPASQVGQPARRIRKEKENPSQDTTSPPCTGRHLALREKVGPKRAMGRHLANTSLHRFHLSGTLHSVMSCCGSSRMTETQFPSWKCFLLLVQWSSMTRS